MLPNAINLMLPNARSCTLDTITCNKLTIWGPFYQKESIHRRVRKSISELKEKTYEDRLRELELPSLVCRRKRWDTILMYKVTNGLVRMGIIILCTPTDSGTQGITLGFLPCLVGHVANVPKRLKGSYSQHLVRVSGVAAVINGRRGEAMAPLI